MANDQQNTDLVTTEGPMTIDSPVVIQENATMNQAVMAMIGMIERVIANPALDVAKLEKLLDIQERILDRQQESLFKAAFAAMQPNLPEIPRNGKSHNGDYALYEDALRLALPVFSKYGFSISHDITSGDKVTTITAILSHSAGHDRRVPIVLPHDTSGSKNAVQAPVSSVSYGKRTTLFAVAGLRSRGEDDDGNAAGVPVKEAAEKSGPKITPAQVAMMKSALGPFEDDWLKANPNVTKLEDMPAPWFTKAHTNAKRFAQEKADKAAAK